MTTPEDTKKDGDGKCQDSATAGAVRRMTDVIMQRLTELAPNSIDSELSDPARRTEFIEYMAQAMSAEPIAHAYDPDQEEQLIPPPLMQGHIMKQP
jgi:hypothetical protein